MRYGMMAPGGFARVSADIDDFIDGFLILTIHEIDALELHGHAAKRQAGDAGGAGADVLHANGSLGNVGFAVPGREKDAPYGNAKVDQ